jgi:3-deoxy-D-manno-octulosonic-acid transferase
LRFGLVFDTANRNSTDWIPMRRLLLAYLLNVAYLFAICLGLPLIIWSMVFRGKYREGYAQKLFGCVPRRDGQGPCIWLHAVSVGEVNVLRPLVAQLERRAPAARLFISSTTKAGFRLARERFGRHQVCYCPLDFTWAVKRALRRIRPDLLILAELELWPNLIWTSTSRGAAVAVVNGRLSEASFRGYSRLRWLISDVVGQIRLIAAQDDATALRFAQLGARPGAVHVTGSLKYDGAETDRQNAATERLRSLGWFAANDIVFLAGSTQAPEEQIVLEAYRSLASEFSRLRLVIVPRHPQRFGEVAELLKTSGLPWLRRSKMGNRNESQPADLEQIPNSKFQTPNSPGTAVDTIWPPPPANGVHGERPLLLVDTIGELGAWWGTADIAFVGGSLGSRGGQNMIEPAAYGAAVCFGPNTRNFRDIVRAMREANAACVVADGSELAAFVRRCLADPAWAADLGRRAQDLVRSQLGATDRTVALLLAASNRPLGLSESRPLIATDTLPSCNRSLS